MQLDLKPIPPTGIVRWMQEKLLRQDIHYDGNDRLTVNVASGASYQSIKTIEKQVTTLPAGITLTLSRRRHALGPALYAAISMDSRAFGTGGGVLEQGCGIMIYPDATVGPDRISITVAGIAAKSRFARFAAAVDQRIPRVRLIRVAGKMR